MKFKGHDIFLDKQDQHYLESHNWYVHRAGKKLYLRGYVKGKRSSGLVYLHRLILNGKEIDHLDGNGLNNARKNLRVCTRTQNNGNRVDYGSKGVYLDTFSGRYKAEIWFEGKKLSLGRYNDFKDAKRAYNRKHKELFKEFANVVEVTA